MKGWGPNSSVCPSKPRETKLSGGISRDICWDILGAEMGAPTWGSAEGGHPDLFRYPRFHPICSVGSKQKGPAEQVAPRVFPSKFAGFERAFSL